MRGAMHVCIPELYAKRREIFMKALALSFAEGVEPEAVAVFPAAPVFTRNNDVTHDYRQDSDLFYLTGFDEPETVLVLLAKERKCVMFVRPRDPERETWDGPRAGVDGAKKEWGADEAFTMSQLAEELPKLLANRN